MPPLVFHEKNAMRQRVRKLQKAGQRVAIVPTMGALHSGHISLVSEAKKFADHVVTTIFVNPTQFAPTEDFSKYPRTLERDLQLLEEAGCHDVFVPVASEIYAPGCTTSVSPPAVALPLEGEFRPGHFAGVCTVVLKLFQIIPADVACFGQKDFQQAAVISAMVRDLDLPLEMKICATIREADGLALSSRNRYLSVAERAQSVALSQALQAAANAFQRGEKNAMALETLGREILNQAGIANIDYVAVRSAESLLPDASARQVMLIACRVGTTRLIDNWLLDQPWNA